MGVAWLWSGVSGARAVELAPSPSRSRPDYTPSGGREHRRYVGTHLQSTSSPLTAGDGWALRPALKADTCSLWLRRRPTPALVLRVLPADLPALLAEVGRSRITLLVLTMQAPPRATQEAMATRCGEGNTESVKKLPLSACGLPAAAEPEQQVSPCSSSIRDTHRNKESGKMTTIDVASAMHKRASDPMMQPWQDARPAHAQWMRTTS
jgi:hypothetical protein